MTIYKPKVVEKKVEKKDSRHTSVAIPEDAKPLAAKKKVDAPVKVLVLPAGQRRRTSAFVACMLFLILFVFIMVAVLGGFFLYQHLFSHKLYIQSAEIRFYEYHKSQQKPTDVMPEAGSRLTGQFTEKIEIDEEGGVYERLDIPPILESRRSTVVHDFEKNVTAIVDRDHGRCFVMPLNRTAVKPPKNFIDLLAKYRTGYYLPDAEIIRDNYKIQLPVVENLEPFGVYIWYDCRFFDTYRLVHDEQPSAIVKRSACEMAGESYCLGEAGSPQILCFKISGCV